MSGGVSGDASVNVSCTFSTNRLCIGYNGRSLYLAGLPPSEMTSPLLSSLHRCLLTVGLDKPTFCDKSSIRNFSFGCARRNSSTFLVFSPQTLFWCLSSFLLIRKALLSSKSVRLPAGLDFAYELHQVLHLRQWWLASWPFSLSQLPQFGRGHDLPHLSKQTHARIMCAPNLRTFRQQGPSVMPSP